MGSTRRCEYLIQLPNCPNSQKSADYSSCCMEEVALFSLSINFQHTATHYTTLQHPASLCITLQHTATPCNTLQHTETHCNTPAPAIQSTQPPCSIPLLTHPAALSPHQTFLSIPPPPYSPFRYPRPSATFQPKVCCSVL